MVARGQVDIEQESIGLVSAWAVRIFFQVLFKCGNGVIERVEVRLKGEFGLIEQGVFPDLEVVVHGGSLFKG